MPKLLFKYKCMNGDGMRAFIKAEHEQVIYCPVCGAVMNPVFVRSLGANEYCFEIMFVHQEEDTEICL